jgi:hypothetical protein
MDDIEMRTDVILHLEDCMDEGPAHIVYLIDKIMACGKWYPVIMHAVNAFVLSVVRPAHARK